MQRHDSLATFPLEDLVHHLIQMLVEFRERTGVPEATNEPSSPDGAALTPLDVARKLKKSRAWVYQRMADGSIPFCQVSTRRRLVRQEDLDAFLIARRG